MGENKEPSLWRGCLAWLCILAASISFNVLAITVADYHKRVPALENRVKELEAKQK